MKYQIDNDLHIHTKLSPCSNDPEQNPERILEYAIANGLKTVCVADHFWDENAEGAASFYKKLDYEYLSELKPLPQNENVRFLFGCETELNKFLNLGISKESTEKFDFIVIPTTHFHMKGFTLTDEEISCAESKAKAWIKRLDAVLNMDLPFHKVGIAHLVCPLIAPTREEYMEVLSLIDGDEMTRLFTKAAKLGVGIELNSADMSYKEHEEDIVLRPFRIAKECGCKFYFGSDAHHPKDLDIAIARFEKAVDALELTEEDKFILKG